MPEYRTIARPVEAIPWIATPDGTAAVIAWAQRFGGYAEHETGGHRASYADRTGHIVNERLVVSTESGIGTDVAYPGDWVVREAGCFHAMPEAVFRKRYEEVPV